MRPKPSSFAAAMVSREPILNSLEVKLVLAFGLALLAGLTVLWLLTRYRIIGN